MTDLLRELVEFLRPCLDEEEKAAHEAFSGQADPEHGWGAESPEWQRHTTITPHVGMIHEAVQADHVVRWNPARVLREVETKRRIVDRYADNPTEPWPLFPLLEMTAVYSDCPGYKSWWTEEDA